MNLAHHLHRMALMAPERPAVLEGKNCLHDYGTLAGRVARAVVAESPGVYRSAWSIADVGAHIDAIRDMTKPLVFPVVPDGHADHIRYSFAMAQRGMVEVAGHG